MTSSIDKATKPIEKYGSNEFDLKQLLNNYIEDESKYKYDLEVFLSAIKARQSDLDFITKFLDQLKKNVALLEPRLFEAKLINLIFFDIKWHFHYSSNKMILNKLSEFLIDLNSAYTNYINKCFTFLIKMFTVVQTSSVHEAKPGTIVAANSLNVSIIDCESLYEFSHHIISHLIKLAPTYKDNLCKLFDSLYPYMIKDTAIQEAYIRNLLKVAVNFVDLRLKLLEICIQKMIKIDVNSITSQIIEAESNQEIADSVNIPMKHPFADRLDVMMYQLFKFINETCSYSTDELNANKINVNLESCKSLFKDLLYIFDKYLINTYGSYHVQFLMFYICSFKPILSEAFIDFLWKKFCNINTNTITRQICSYYMGSFLARAKHVPIKSCVATLTLMIAWIHNYIDKTNSNIKSTNSNNAALINSLDIHRTFYSLCQTVFYIIIFRNKQLFQSTQPNTGSQQLTNAVKSWKLNEIVSSKLNPLRYCLRSIRKKFARIAYINQIAYCYSIIDNNNRLTIPISGQSTQKINMFFSNQNNFLDNLTKTNQFNKKTNECVSNPIADNPLDSFFPFDPYLLSRSKCFIQNIYQEFQNVVDQDMDSDSDDESEDEEDENEEDMEDDEDDELDEENENIEYDLVKELQDDDSNHEQEKLKTDFNLNLNTFNFNWTYSNDEDD